VLISACSVSPLALRSRWYFDPAVPVGQVGAGQLALVARTDTALM
jgi:hypothetical protein